MSIGFSGAGGHAVRNSCEVGVSLDAGVEMPYRTRSILLQSTDVCCLLLPYQVSR